MTVLIGLIVGLHMSIEDLESDSGSEDSFGSDTEETARLIGKSEPLNQNNEEISNGSTVNRDHKLSSKYVNRDHKLSSIGSSTHEPNDRSQNSGNDLCDSGIESISNGDTHGDKSPKR